MVPFNDSLGNRLQFKKFEFAMRCRQSLRETRRIVHDGRRCRRLPRENKIEKRAEKIDWRTSAADGCRDANTSLTNVSAGDWHPWAARGAYCQISGALDVSRHATKSSSRRPSTTVVTTRSDTRPGIDRRPKPISLPFLCLLRPYVDCRDGSGPACRAAGRGLRRWDICSPDIC